MNFLAVLDYEHLDNGMFLTAFARSLARQEKSGIIIHGDSEYTDRLIQTGMMRKDARLRAIRDLNNRLVALFADEGVSTIGLNGHQKSLLRYRDDEIIVDENQFNRFPSQPMLLISGLAEVHSNPFPKALSLPHLALSLQNSLGIDEITIFSTDERSNIVKGDFPMELIPGKSDSVFLEKHVPESFHRFGHKVTLTTADEFRT